MHKNKLFSRILFAALLIAGLSCSNESQIDNSIALTGNWKIIKSDNIENSLPYFNDSDKPEITMPGNWSSIIRENDNLTSTVWLRKKIFISKKMKGKPLTLALGRIGVADETFFNGVQIGSTGKFPHSPECLHYHFSWLSPRNYFIPATLVKFGSYNTISIRIYSHVISGITGYMALNVYNENYFMHRYSNHTSLVINITSIALNFIFFLGLIFLFITQREKREYLYFAALVLLSLIHI